MLLLSWNWCLTTGVFLVHSFVQLHKHSKMLLYKPALRSSGCENGKKSCLSCFKLRTFTYSSAGRIVMVITAEREKQDSWLWGLGRRRKVGWEILIPLSLMPLLFGLGICCEILMMYTARIHRVYLRFGTFAKCIKGVWREYLALIMYWDTPPYISFLLWPLNVFALLFFEGTQWSNSGCLQLEKKKPKINPRC